MKISSVILVLLTLLALNAQAKSCKGQRGQIISEKIASWSPQVSTNLLDIDLFPGGTINTKYRYEVEPAYTHGLYQRKDRWILETKAIPTGSEVLNEHSAFNYSGGLQNTNEINFYRFYKDPCEALLAKPFIPRHLPLKAKNALSDNFSPGNYFTFRSSVGFVVSSEILSLVTSGLWGTSVGASYLMEGFYQVHLLRLDDSHVRLKVTAHRGKDYSASFSLGYKGDFEVFKVGALDHQLERIVNTTPVKIQGDIKKSKVFLVDYILDLKDEEVASAFERIIRKPKYFKNIKIASPFKDIDLEKDILLDLSPLEELYLKDLNQNTVSRIKRNLHTNSEQSAYSFSLKTGNDLLKFQAEREISNAFMNVKQESEDEQKYFMKSWKKDWSGKLLVTFIQNEEEDTLNAIFKSENSIADATPINIVQEITHKNNRFSYKKFLKLKLLLKKALPLEIYHQLPLDTWKQGPKDKYSNFGLRYQVVLDPESISEAPELTADQVKNLFLQQMKEKNLSPSDYIPESNGSDDYNGPVPSGFSYQLETFSTYVSKALNQDLPIRQRLNQITLLRRNILFNQSGIGFLMSLSGDKMKKRFHVDVDISSREANIDYSFGDAQISALYKKILTIKSALDDDAFDLLREAESLSIPVNRASGE